MLKKIIEEEMYITNIIHYHVDKLRFFLHWCVRLLFFFLWPHQLFCMIHSNDGNAFLLLSLWPLYCKLCCTFITLFFIIIIKKYELLYTRTVLWSKNEWLLFYDVFRFCMRWDENIYWTVNTILITILITIKLRQIKYRMVHYLLYYHLLLLLFLLNQFNKHEHKSNVRLSHHRWFLLGMCFFILMLCIVKACEKHF